MKILPRRAQLAEDGTQQEDTTTEFEAGTERMAHRRTTVTVERETVSVLIQRPVAEPPAQSAGEENAPEPPDKNLPEELPEMPNYLTGGKP